MPNINYRITQVTRTEKQVTKAGVVATQRVYTDQTGQVIRKSFNKYGAICAYVIGIPSFHANVANAKKHLASKVLPETAKSAQIVEIRDGAEVAKAARQVALDTLTPSVVESPVEVNSGQNKETAVSTPETQATTPETPPLVTPPLVINFTEEIKGVPAVKDADGNETTPAVPFTPGTCRCGCGQPVGKGSKFLPGHDARHKGNLQRAAIAGASVIVNGTETTALDAAYTDEFDYRENVQRALDKAATAGKSAEEKATERAEKKAAKDAEKADAKAKRDAKRAEDKAARDAEREAKRAAKQAETVAKAEAADLAKASNGTVDPAKAVEVTEDAAPAVAKPRATRG